MEWLPIIAGAALAAALAALLYAWAGFRATVRAINDARQDVDTLAVVVSQWSEQTAKIHELDATLADHLQWHVAARMRNSVSLLRDIEETNDQDRE